MINGYARSIGGDTFRLDRGSAAYTIAISGELSGWDGMTIEL